MELIYLQEELLTHEKSIEEMYDYIKQNLKIFNIDGMYKALTGSARNINYPQLVTTILQENIRLNLQTTSEDLKLSSCLY